MSRESSWKREPFDYPIGTADGIFTFTQIYHTKSNVHVCKYTIDPSKLWRDLSWGHLKWWFSKWIPPKMPWLFRFWHSKLFAQIHWSIMAMGNQSFQSTFRSSNQDFTPCTKEADQGSRFPSSEVSRWRSRVATGHPSGIREGGMYGRCSTFQSWRSVWGKLQNFSWKHLHRDWSLEFWQSQKIKCSCTIFVSSICCHSDWSLGHSDWSLGYELTSFGAMSRHFWWSPTDWLILWGIKWHDSRSFPSTTRVLGVL